MSTERFEREMARFVDLAADKARANGLVIAQAKGEGLHLKRNRSPDAVASLIAAARACGRSAPPLMRGEPPTDEHALAHVDRHDLTQWWSWSHPSSKPMIVGDDEYYTADEVARMVASGHAYVRASMV
jgi:hypothetical protein